mgnify:FL=1
MTEQQGRGDSNHAGRQVTGPGRLVRDARLRREMSVDQVAESLHLDRRTVEQLEADDFDALPPLTFVRGYLRAYCQLMDLDPGPVVERLADIGVTDNESPLKAHAGAETGSARAPRPVSRGPGFLGLALGLALLITAVVAVGWWMSRSELSIPFVGSNAPETGSVAGDDASGNGRPANGEAGETPAPRPDTAVASSDAQPMAPSNTTGNTNADQPVEGEVTPAPDSTPEASAPAMTPSSSAAAQATPDASPINESAEGEAPPAEGLDSLVFRFSGDSWMEVIDHRGERPFAFDFRADG